MTDDETILHLFFARSEQAILELDQKYGALCRSLSRNIVGNRLDAEECVNDAYLGAWNAIPPARPAPLRAYLIKLVRNISLNCYWKKAAAKRSSNCTVAIQEIESCLVSGSNVEDEIGARELARIIEAFLDTLSAKERLIFMRRYAYLDSYADIARRLNISEKNVSVRLTQLRHKLKKYLLEREVSV